MSEFVMERLKENLMALKMKNTLETIDNYLERAVKDDLNRECRIKCVNGNLLLTA